MHDTFLGGQMNKNDCFNWSVAHVLRYNVLVIYCMLH